MKKSFMVMLSILLVLGAFILEGGSLRTLMIATALVPIIVGSFISALFSYSMAEIGLAFKDGFCERTDLDRVEIYRMDLLIIKNLESSVLYWSLTIVILAIIGILSSLTNVNHLGPSLAAGTVSLLLGFGLRAVLLTPLENSIIKKLTLAENQLHTTP